MNAYPRVIEKLTSKKSHRREIWSAQEYSELHDWILRVRDENMTLREQNLSLQKESLALQQENQQLRGLLHQIEQVYDTESELRKVMDKYPPPDQDKRSGGV